MEQNQPFLILYLNGFFNKNLIRFINFKSLILTQCYLSEILINNLSLLVQYQLDELILTIDKDSLETFYYEYESCMNARNQGKLKFFVKQSILS